ncbi:MAG TPA: hypothetical protein VKB49_08085, partial [Candidatus Sulfotelmatobacter sp.]|nr:hypothetical protein [Candidatus Sulfotelmatobacter sp.]
MLSGAGVQRSGTPAESKHPYLGTTAAGRYSSLGLIESQMQAMGLGLHQFLNRRSPTRSSPAPLAQGKVSLPAL